MASDKKQLSVFFGSEDLTFIEASKGNVIFSDFTEHALPRGAIISPDQENTESIKLTAFLQRITRERRITQTDVHLSLPVKDIIFRSFSIPMMTPQEMENVVKFEAKRYIPFKIEELYYTFQYTPAVENGIRKARILFLAIRKTSLNRYCNILEQAGFEAISAEPSALGLLKLLSFKKAPGLDKKIAVVDIDGLEGSITIAEKQIPQFIRDFKLFSSNEKQLALDSQQVIDRLINELTISLDFYARQNKKANREHNIGEIFVFANQHAEEIAAYIKKESGITATPFDAKQILPVIQENQSNILHALGASLTNIIRINSGLDLIRAKAPGAKAPSGFDIAGFGNTPPNYSLTAKIAGACFLVVALTFWWTYSQFWQYESKILNFKASVQKYQMLKASDIKMKSAVLKKKSQEYKGIRLNSDTSLFLAVIPKMLPDGVWLDALDITYEDIVERDTLSVGGRKQRQTDETAFTEITVSMNGYAYARHLNEQMSLIETFIKRLKINPDLKNKFKELRLENVTNQNLEGFEVTYFNIILTVDGSYDRS